MNEPTKVFESSQLGLIVRSEIDSQIATAKKYPREVEQSIANAQQLATTNKKIAQKCIYFRPVGKKDGKTIFADGESIRLAEILFSCWGNLRVASRSLGMEDGKIIAQGICHDLQSNVALSSEVTKSVRKRNGQMYSDNQIEVVQGAAGAIARRNAILSVIPRVFAQQVMDAVVDKIAGGTEDEIKKVFDKGVLQFNKIGVSEKDLLLTLEIPDKTTIKKEHIVQLSGIYNAINDGICSVQDVFGHAPTKIEPPKEKKGKKKKNKTELEDETIDPAQTPKQRYATTNLEYLEKFGVEKADQVVAEQQRKTGRFFKEFSNEDFDAVASRMVDELLVEEEKGNDTE